MKNTMRIIAVLILILLALSTLVGCGALTPQANFTAIPTAGRAPLDVQFNDKSTGNISNWEWDFNGDDVVDSTVQNPEYTYEIPGNYTVSLTVTSPEGSDTEIKKDYIEVTRCQYLADFIIEPIPGNCQIEDNKIVCTGTTTVKFIDKSTGNITAWEWNFGDDKTSAEQNPSHVYTRDGNYTVTLTITTPECKDSVTKWDYINLTGCST
jgi:PKD repeat protein